MGLGKYVRHMRKGRLTLGGFAFAGVVALVGLLILQQPMEVYASIDPGLDSGNATVDRTSVPGQTILLYKTTGSSTFKAPAGVTSARVLVIAGGGSGGNNHGGGGGAGELYQNTSFAVTPGQSTAVTVGNGGAAASTNGQIGNKGDSSVFGSVTVNGGGGGGGRNLGPGQAGGSGGGGAGNTQNVDSRPGGASTTTGGGQGNNGGNGVVGAAAGSSIADSGAGAGGGGAGAVGVNAASKQAGNGGAGVNNDITGTSVGYAGGGGAAGWTAQGIAAGTASHGGGAGPAGADNSNGTSGTANTGAGGGGGGPAFGDGGAGGSGMIIVRFATQNLPDPGGVSGVKMWYKADSAGNTNAQWNDVSGFGYNLTQGTVSKQPVLTTNSLNFNPAYVFDGTDDAFSLPTHGIGSSDSLSAFYAANSTNTAGGYRYFNEFGDDRPSITINNGKPNLYVRDTSSVEDEYSTIAALNPHVYSFVSPNGGGSKIIGVDNKEQAKTITGSYSTGGGASGNTFGGPNASAGTSWIGPFGEAIYFNRQLTQQERQRVNSYLGIKYGVTLDQGSSGTAYLGSDGSTIWPADATYKNAVTGIGRDDTSTLNQKQSKNTGDIVTVGHRGISSTNQANSNNFNGDRSFLIWGHNGAATNQTTAVGTTGIQRMNRIWKAVATSDVDQITLRIPTSEVASTNGKLLISNSATFDNSSQVVNMTQNGSNYEATVTGLATGTHYFTFGSFLGTDIQFVSKTATDIGGDPITSYTPGESMQYVLRVKNNGPDNAGTVTVTDTLPAGLVPVSGTGGGWNCSIAGQTATCTRSALNNGNTAPDIIIETTIASSVTGSKANTATATVANDPDTSNNSASLTLPAAPRADLNIAKAHSGTPTAGGQYTYNFTVKNDGPSDVSSFTVADTLDSNLSLASSTGNICSAAAQVVTCTGGALTNGQVATFSMVVNVAAGYPGGAISNTGTVSVPAGTTDPDSNNNSSTDATNVFVSTDLTIAKTHTGSFTAGVNNTFKITVASQGPSNSPTGTVTVTDTLDEDFAFVSAIGTGWSCTHTSGTVSCTNTAPITAGSSAPDITVTVLVDSAAKTSTTNTAKVSSTTPDPDPTTNSSTDTVTIDSTADLAITKAHIGTAFVAGRPEQYSFTVTNNGPSADAPSYTISDTLPAGLTYVSATGEASCSAAAQVVTCTGGDIPAGAPAQVTTITVSVSGSATGTISNTATIATAAGTTDPDTSNNTDTDTVSVEPNADLSITKQHTGNLTAGANEAYTITVHNAGPSDVSSFTVSDTLDDNLTFQTTSGCSAAAQVVTCTGGAITSGNDAIITLNVSVASTATPGASIQNTATVAPPNTVNDPDMSNNSSSVSNTVATSADLSINKSHTGNFTAGANNTFTIAVTNNGPSDATTATVTDVLPSGLTYVSATGADCANAGQTVTCLIGPTIGAGQTVTVTLTVLTDAGIAGGSTRSNTASVSSATADPDTSNNSDGDTVTINSSADLGIVKSHTSDFTAGNNENYNFAITNAGPSNVSSYTVTDTLPAGLTYVSSSPSICSAAAQVVTCTGGALTAGANNTFTMTVAISGGISVGSTVVNTGTIAPPAGTTDPNSANNSSTDTATVVGSADLVTTKTHVGTLTAGTNGQYTIAVKNNGPSDTPANDVTITDTLPTGITYVSGSAGWNCGASTSTVVNCVYTPALVNGATATLTVTVHIASDKQGQVTNSATASSSTYDPSPGDATGTDTTTIAAVADLTATKTAQGTLTAGRPVIYHFDITNNGGPSVANSVTIQDNLPAYLTYQSFDGGDESWNCSSSGQTVTCTFQDALNVGSSASVDVTMLVGQDAPNPATNTAAVTFNGTDPTPANPSTTDPVSYSADLEVDISHDKSIYHAGDTIVYDYAITNHGPSAATNAVMTSTLPDGLTITGVSGTSPGGGSILSMVDSFFFARASAASNPFGCHLSGQQLTCNASTLSVGTYHIYLTGTISSSFAGRFVTTAHITSATPDPNTADTSATDVISDVLAAAGGLTNTGENILLWSGAALAVIVTSVLVFLRSRRKRALT